MTILIKKIKTHISLENVLLSAMSVLLVSSSILTIISRLTFNQFIGINSIMVLGIIYLRLNDISNTIKELKDKN
jgi:hypothetical protein